MIVINQTNGRLCLRRRTQNDPHAGPSKESRMRNRLLVLILSFGAMALVSACGDVTQITEIGKVSIDTVVKYDTVPAPKDTAKTDTTHASGISVVLQPTVLVFHLYADYPLNQVYQLLWEVKNNGMRHSNQNVSFRSVQNNGVVDVGSTGLIRPLKVGTALIIVTAMADTMARDTTFVTVDAPPGGAASITVFAPAGATMRVGTSQQLTATVVGAADPTGTWLSSNSQYVMANSQSGIVTAFSIGSAQVCYALRTNPTNIPPGCANISVTP